MSLFTCPLAVSSLCLSALLIAALTNSMWVGAVTLLLPLVGHAIRQCRSRWMVGVMIFRRLLPGRTPKTTSSAFLLNGLRGHSFIVIIPTDTYFADLMV